MIFDSLLLTVNIRFLLQTIYPILLLTIILIGNSLNKLMFLEIEWN